MGIRKAYAPFSKVGENVATTPVEGYLDVIQEARPTIATGNVDENGLWTGIKSSDREFGFYSKDEAIGNGGAILCPTQTGTMSMVGFNDMQIAIRPTNGGNYKIEAVMSSDGSQPYYNLNPPDAAAVLRGMTFSSGLNAGMDNVILDSAESLTADVWNIFMIGNSRLKNQARLGFRITNNSGDISTIETTFLRLV